MSNESNEPVDLALATLSSRELHAYKIWAGSNKPSLAPSLNAKLFQLYLNGKDCEEIRRLNPQLSLGEIAAAKIQGEWGRRREEHLSQLLEETSKRVQQTSMETTDFLCDILTAANREHGDKLRRFIQTGDSKDLGDFKIQSLASLKTVIETLYKLTGQDKQSQVRITGEVVHRKTEVIRPTSAEAGAVLKLITDDKR